MDANNAQLIHDKPLMPSQHQKWDHDREIPHPPLRLPMRGLKRPEFCLHLDASANYRAEV